MSQGGKDGDPREGKGRRSGGRERKKIREDKGHGTREEERCRIREGGTEERVREEGWRVGNWQEEHRG